MQAEDDPTPGCPASLLWSGDDDVFAFPARRRSAPDLIRQLTERTPVLARAGDRVRHCRAGRGGTRTPTPSGLVPPQRGCRCSRSEAFRSCCRAACFARPPGSRSTSPPRASRRAVRAASSPHGAGADSTGGSLSVTSSSASEELGRARSGQGAVHPSRRTLARAPPLGRRDGAALPRPPPRGRRDRRPRPRRLGLETDEAGLELGEVTLDDAARRARSATASGASRRSATPRGDDSIALFPFQERGHGWLRMLGDLGIGAILADDMGLGKTVQAIAMLASEREQFGRTRFGPTLVVCPMSVAQAVGAPRSTRFAPSLRVHLHHGGDRLAGDGARRRRAATSDIVDHLLRHRHARHRHARRRRAGTGCCSTRRRTSRTRPTKRARALRRLDARRTARDDRHADREPARRALGDHGHRQPGPARLARAGSSARSRGRSRRTATSSALERLRAIVQPFILRRAEGRARGRARAAADHDREGLLPADGRAGEPLPGDGRPLAAADRGARATASAAAARCSRCSSQLKQVCNHPEMVLHDRAAARRAAPASSSASSSCCEQVPADDKALVFTQYPASTGSCRTSQRAARPRASASSTAASNARQRDELLARVRERRTARRCS